MNKIIPLRDRLKTIKNYHTMGNADQLSTRFVEKAIDEALKLDKAMRLINKK